MIDLLTVGVSVGSSLVVSYIGVRYFTRPRMRAERADAARLAIRDIVSPLQRDLRAFRAHMKSGLQRDHVAHPDDAVIAIRLLTLSHDLPKLGQRRVRRRLNVIFGSGWMRIASLRDATVAADEKESASFAMAAALLDRHDGPESRSYTDGLLHRAYVAGPDSPQAKELERHLMLLAEVR